MSDMTDVEIRERLAHIDQLNAEAARRRQEFELAYPQFWISAIASAAALLGAGAAIGVVLVKFATG